MLLRTSTLLSHREHSSLINPSAAPHIRDFDFQACPLFWNTWWPQRHSSRKNFSKAQFGEAIKDRLEILDDVLGPSRIDFGGEAPINVPARLQAMMKQVDRLGRIDQMLEYIHRGNEIEPSLGQLGLLEIDEACVETPRIKAIFAKRQHHAADISQGDVEALAAEEQRAGADARAEIETGLTTGRRREFQSDNIGER